MLRSFKAENPEELMQGWLVEGEYRVDNTKILSSTTP